MSLQHKYTYVCLVCVPHPINRVTFPLDWGGLSDLVVVVTEPGELSGNTPQCILYMYSSGVGREFLLGGWNITY